MQSGEPATKTPGRWGQPAAIAGLPYGVGLALVALAYFGVAKLGLSFAGEHAIVSAVWPPSGLALAAVVVLGYRVWPAIAVGALLANATGDSSLLTAAGIATGNALAALTGGYLLARVGFDAALRRIRDVVALVILGATVSTALNASVGVGALWAGGVVDLDGLWSFWRVWWLGDMTGVLLVAPALLTVTAGIDRTPHGARIAEASVLLLALVGVTLLVLHEALTLAYPVFPLIVVAALRFRQPGAVVAALVVSSIAVIYTASGQGPFAGSSSDVDLLSAQLFVALAAITGLLVAAMRSERETAEKALARLGDSQRALAEAQELAHIGSWEWDIPADRIWWSDELYRIFGVDRDSFGASYESYLSCIHPDDRELVDGEVRRAFERAAPFHFEHRVLRPDGEIRTVNSHGRLLCDEHGRPLKMLGTGQDVTEPRLAEERFRSLLESAPDAMVIVDERGEIVLVNSQTEQLFGYRRDELIGQSVEILIPASVRDAHPRHRGQFLADPHARPMGTGLDLSALRKDGSTFPVEVSLSPLRTADGTLVSSAIRDVTDRKLAEQKLAHQALHDPLTGLPNRTLFMDRLEHALARSRRPGARLATFFCDIDDFKKVNDSLGHEAGDELLTALPPRLRTALRTEDTVARFGGDEFVILCEDLASEGDAIRIAERITDAFGRPLMLAGREHHLSISVGVVFVEAGQASAAGMLRDADIAMYRAKARGKGRYELFDERMRARVVERLQIEEDLRRAVDDGELRLLYQPMLSLEHDAFTGAEALLRWEHPRRGLLAPSEFIGVAEESGLIVPIGAWVLGEACRRAAGWPRGEPGDAPLRVSINLSLRQVSDSNIVGSLARVLEETGVEPAVVELEITENMLLDGGEASLATLRQLRGIGVRLVLDDFGTGYSSLSRLKRFPIDALKLDREFIGGLGTEAQDTAIVSALLSMARALELDVVAEGVETAEQLEWLQAHGCGFAQGHLLSPPIPPEELDGIAPWMPAPAPLRAAPGAG